MLRAGGALTVLLWTSLAAAEEPPPRSVAVTTWALVNVPADLATFYASEVAGALRREGLKVVTAQDIAAVLGLERQKQLLGCAEDSASCMAELGSAMGCDLLLTGSLARLEDTYRGALKLVSARDGTTVAEEPVEASGQKALADRLAAAAQRLARALRPAPPPPAPRALAWVPLAGGLALGAGAAACFAVAGSNYERMLTAQGAAEGQRLQRDGEGLQAAGWVLTGVGAAALVTAGALFLFGDAKVTPTASVGPAGAVVGVRGVLP